MKKLYLVDVSSMYFRAFYAIRPLSNKAGMPTNALYGFLSMTVKLLREVRPEFMAFCFDRPEVSFRKDLDPRYKANRNDMPEDLIPQVPFVRRLTEELGIAALDMKGFEADDVIGTLTEQGVKSGHEVVIVSGDKDFAQLIRPGVTMLDTMKDFTFNSEAVTKKWGVPPNQFRDYLAITGDASDNFLGIKGIGPKGAVKLLQDYGTIENIYNNIDKITPAGMRKKLEEGREEAFLSQKLVTICLDVPLDCKIDDLELKLVEQEILRNTLEELGFQSFIPKLIGAPSSQTILNQTGASSNLSVQTMPTQTIEGQFGQKFSIPLGDTSSNQNNESTNVASTGHLGLVNKASGIKRGSAKKITHENGDVVENKITKSKVAKKGKAAQSAVFDFEADYTPIRAFSEIEVTAPKLRKWLNEKVEVWLLQTDRWIAFAEGDEVILFSGESSELAAVCEGLDLKFKGFALKSLWHELNLSHPLLSWDSELAAYLIKSVPVADFRDVFSEYTQKGLPEFPRAMQLYSAHLELEEALRKNLIELNLIKIFEEVDLPLAPLLYLMEKRGVQLDSDELKRQSATLQSDLQELEKKIFDEAKMEFNILSPKQLGDVIFEKLKLPRGKKTKTGYSTNSEVLETLVEFPIAALVLKFRELSKLKATYTDSLPTLINPKTGRLHTIFGQATTTTGRLSSSQPNIQNIPIRTERGRLVRKAFVARPGFKLISADYSQIELRILAHIAKDRALRSAFEEDIDIHTATASEVFEVSVDNVTSELRRKAKAVNFGIAYGQGAFGLAETLKISRSEAKEIIQRYFQKFPGVQDYMTTIVEIAKDRGYVETLMGRRRYMHELKSSNAAVRSFGERAAINAPIQGTAADLVKVAMLDVFKKVGDCILLQVHDELIFEVEEDRVEHVLPIIREAMENCAKLDVPLKVNIAYGNNWDEAH